MPRTFWLSGPAVLVFALAAPAAKYSIKVSETPPPKELPAAFAKLLGPQAIAFLNSKGETVCEVWFRKELPLKSGAKGSLNYRSLQESTVVGAFRAPKIFYDYRQQKIKPGVYTMRLGFQPSDGNHMGTALYNDFCLLLPIALDTSPEPLKQKQLFQKSNKAAGTGHPGVLMLFPNPKPEEAPLLKYKGEGHYVLFTKVGVEGGKALGFGVTLAGHAAE